MAISKESVAILKTLQVLIDRTDTIITQLKALSNRQEKLEKFLQEITNDKK